MMERWRSTTTQSASLTLLKGWKRRQRYCPQITPCLYCVLDYWRSWWPGRLEWSSIWWQESCPCSHWRTPRGAHALLSLQGLSGKTISGICCLFFDGLISFILNIWFVCLFDLFVVICLFCMSCFELAGISGINAEESWVFSFNNVGHPLKENQTKPQGWVKMQSILSQRALVGAKNESILLTAVSLLDKERITGKGEERTGKQRNA